MLDFTNFDAQVKALQAALANANSSAKKFSAAVKQSNPDLELLELAMVNNQPQWLWEILHPKGMDGKFIKKGSADYIYGHAKTASFDAGKAAHTGTYTPKDVTLEPGESLYQTAAGTVFRLNENGQAKVWVAAQNKWADNWTDAPAGAGSWIDYFKGDVSLLDKNEPEVSVHADSLDEAEKAVKVAQSFAEPTAAPATPAPPKYVFAWTKTKVIDALLQKTNKQNSNYLYAQSSFYNPKKDGDAADNKKSYAQRDALTRLAMAYEDSGDLESPNVAGATYANFLLQNAQPDDGYSIESGMAQADAMDSLADFIESDPKYDEVVVTNKGLKINNSDGTKKTILPSEWLRGFAQGFRDAVALSSFAPEPVEAHAEVKKVEKAATDVKAVETPDVPGKKPADASVITTKAGPPYGPNVWITPDFTDADGKPYLMSSQGEKNIYSVFAPGTPPAIIQTTKGENFDGVSNDGLLHTGVNKKSAKAWLAENHTVVLPPTPDDGLADWEKELMGIMDEPAPAAAGPDFVVNTPDELGDFQKTWLDQVFNASTAKGADLWVAADSDGKIMGAIIGYGDDSGLAVDENGNIDYSVPTYDDVPSIVKASNLQKVVVTNPDTLPPASAPEKKPDIEVKKETKNDSPSVTIKFTKNSKSADGTITWKVLGAKDEHGGDYNVLSYKGEFNVYDSNSAYLTSFTSAKDAKAWIAAQSAGKTADPEEIPPTENLPEWALGATKTTPELDKVVPALQTGNVKDTKYLIAYIDDKNNKDNNITYGVDANGVVTSSSLNFGTTLMGENVLDGFELPGSDLYFFAGENPLYKEPSADEVSAALPASLADFEQMDFVVPPLPFGDQNKAVWYAWGNGGKGQNHFVGLDANGEVVAGTSGIFDGKLNISLDQLESFTWTVNPTPSDKVVLGAQSYHPDTPEWIKDEGIPYIESAFSHFPAGTAYSMSTKDGYLIGVDGEGYVSSDGLWNGDKAALHSNDIAVYYGPVGENKPNPYEANKVADVSLPDTPETEADGLPEGLESPSEENPTPGDPKAHLAVPVVGYKKNGKTVAGTYLTKKMKNEQGKPYLITSMGKANNWEVFEDVAHFESDEAPLSVHKQLKDAKAWLANGGAKFDEPLSTPHGDGQFFQVGSKSYFLSGDAKVWKKPAATASDNDLYYIQQNTASAWTIVVHPNGTITQTESKNLNTPKKVADLGLTQVLGDGKPAAKVADLWAQANTANLPKPDKEFDSSTVYTSPWNFTGDTFAKMGDGAWDGAYAYAQNKALETGDNPQGTTSYNLTPEKERAFAQALLEHVGKFDWAGLMDEMQKRRAAAYGPEKTKWGKAIGRTQSQILTLNALQRIADGKVQTGDFDLIEATYGDHHHTGDLSLPYQQDQIVNHFIKGMPTRKVKYGAAAEALGLDPSLINLVDHTYDLPDDQVESWKNKMAEQAGVPELVYLDSNVFKTYLYRAVIGDVASQDALISKAQKSIKTYQSVQKAKEFFAAKAAGEDVSQSLADKASLAISGDAFSIAVSDMKMAMKGDSAPEVDFEGTKYGWGVFSSKWVPLDGDSSDPNYKTFTPLAMNYLLQSGLAQVTAGDVAYSDTDTKKWSGMASEGTEGVLWPLPDNDLLELSGKGDGTSLYGFLDGGNPILLSQIDVPSNPFTYADTPTAWASLYEKVEAEMPDVLSGDIKAYPYSKYVEVFGLANYYKDAPDGTTFGATAKIKSWIANTIVPKLNEVAPTSHVAVKEFGSLEKPADIFNLSDDAWTIAVAAAQGLDLPVFSQQQPNNNLLNKSLSGYVDAALNEVGSGGLDNVPTTFLKFYAALQNGSIEGIAGSSGPKIMAALVKSGIWMPGDQKMQGTVNVHGDDYKLDVYPGDVVWKGETSYGSLQYLLVKPNGTVYTLDTAYDYDKGAPVLKVSTTNGEIYISGGGIEPNATDFTWEPIYHAPVDFNYEFLQSKVDGLSKTSYDLFDLGFLSGSKAWGDVSLPNFGSVTQGDSLIHMKKFLADTEDEDWKNVGKMWGEISPAGKKTLHWAQANGNSDIPKLVLQAKKYGQFANGGDAAKVSKDAIYYDHVAKGKVSIADISSTWTGTQEQQAAYDLLGVSFEKYWSNLVKYRSDLSDALQDKGSVGTAEKKNTPTSMADSLVLHPASFSLGGMHTKGTWADEDGNKWLSKAFNSDPNALARIEAEHYAMRIGALFGYNPPATGIMKTPDGKTSYVQHYADAAGNLEGFNWSDLSEGALHTAMEQHVLDWIISNHDSHAGNILRTVDGSSTYPIDRGQAFKFLGQDKLKVGYLPPGNGAPVWYDEVYNAIKNNSMSKEKADAVRDAVLRKAAIVTARNDDEYRDYVTKALAHRTSLPASFSSTSAMVDYLMERKASTFEDFNKFWGDLYKSAGYDYGTHSIDNYLPKKLGEAHVSITPELAEDVQKSHSVGVPVFFAGTELDNGHMQFFTTKDSDGDDTLRVQTKLLSDADDVLQAWLSKQTIEKVSGGYGYTPPAPAKPSHSKLPGLSNGHSNLTNFVKTVGSHIKKGDYEFNATTVAAAENFMNNLQTAINAIQAHAFDNPVKPYELSVLGDGSFVTMEQQDAWLAAADKMLNNFKIVKEAMETKVSVSQTHPDLVPFVEPGYTPSTWVDKDGDTKLLSSYEYNGEAYSKYSNGAYTVTPKDGAPAKSNQNSFDTAAAHGSALTVDAGDTPSPEEETEVTVSAGTQIIKVTHRQAQFYSGVFDKNKMTVTENSGALSNGVYGMEYLIEVDGIKMQFQSAKDVSVSSQKGLLRMEISKWTGDTQQIEKALTALRSMGLELNEADEKQLELLYWRQLRHTLNKRKLNAKWKAVQKDLDTKGVSPAMNADEELAAYREAFKGGYGADVVDNFVQKQGWLPQVGKYAGDGQTSNGRPWWYRPDMDIERLKTAHSGRLLRHSIGGYSVHESMGKLGFFPTEERMRVLGEFIDGMSSGSDQHKGSSEYLFFRQNQNLTGSSLYLEPTEYFRTSNYSFTSDEYGNENLKVSKSPFEVWDAAKFSDSDNETMVKNGISLMDGMAVIIVDSESTRQAIIKFYEDMGVTEIRGIPVSERVVTSTSAAQATINKVWDYWINKQKSGEPLWATA